MLSQNKVVSCTITGGPDNVPGVAWQLLGFFSELGGHIPQFPYSAHARGWTAEDRERNIAAVQHSAECKAGARALVTRATTLAGLLLGAAEPRDQTPRGGRKGHRLEVESP